MPDKNPKNNETIKHSDGKINESWDFTSKKNIEHRNNDLNRYNITAQETNPAFDSFFDSKGKEKQQK
ncbi:hypothetical protein CF160_03605 [Enterococcus pseudoavium]|nr:hypothetical protein CF160_03605 [Enterococcus pseudoavium]